MTALCAGGGPSQPNPGTTSALVFASTVAGLVELAPGAQWLIPFVAGGAVLTYNLPTFCATDPPAMPSFTDVDILALATADATVLGHAARQKVSDLLSNLVWGGFCQCVSGAQPPAPVAPSQPGGYTYVGDGSGAFCLPMYAGSTKVLTLWNGSTNIAPPANWQLPTFNDAAWPVGTQSAGNTAAQWAGTTTGLSSSARIQLDAGVLCQGDAVAPWLTCTTTAAQYLVRWKFNLPAFIPSRITMTPFNFSNADGGWTSGQTWINGTNTNSLGDLNVEAAVPYLRPGANTIAVWVNVLNTSNAVTWGTTGAISYRIAQNGLSSPVSGPAGCCPPDPSIMVALARLQTAVDLIQRQAVPFAYVAGAVHAGLSGNGQFAVQGLLGLAVAVTTVPGRAGAAAGDPNAVYDLGWLNVGTADGWRPRERISANPFILKPIGGDVTLVGYSIPADVVVTITELVREP